MAEILNPYSDEEWQRRLKAGVAETLRKKAERREEREQKKARRDAGLVKRYEAKDARLVAAAVVPVADGRCRYLVDIDALPPVACPNEAIPSGTLCRPHTGAAVALARRLGLIPSDLGERP